MQVTSVVRQGQVLAIAALFTLPLAFGLVWVVGALMGVSGFSSVLVVGGVVLMLIAGTLITLCLLSYTIRASVGPDGLFSGEIGARWSLRWSAVFRIWIVSYRGQQFLAVLPPPDAPPIRTAWRSRRMGLPEATRTVRIAPESVADLAAAITAYRGVPPEAHAG